MWLLFLSSLIFKSNNKDNFSVQKFSGWSMSISFLKDIQVTLKGWKLKWKGRKWEYIKTDRFDTGLALSTVYSSKKVIIFSP